MRPHALMTHAADSHAAGGVYLHPQDAGDRRITIALRSPHDDHTEAIVDLDQRDAEQLALDLLAHTRPRPRDVGAWQLPDGRLYVLIDKHGAFLGDNSARQLHAALGACLPLALTTSR